MTKEEAIKWLKNLYSDIGQMQFRALWDYGQAIDEIIDLLSADKYVPNKSCFDCMERGTGMCNGTIQEQSWCPHVADIPNDSVQGGWIPVIEMLPEEETDVLVTVYFKGLEQRHKTGWNDHIKPKHYVEVASQINGEWHSYSDEYKVARNRHEVLAWMPLPEPYREENEE